MFNMTAFVSYGLFFIGLVIRTQDSDSILS